MLTVHKETGLTGNFRLFRGVLECEVTITTRGTNAGTYTTYRPATANDHFEAEYSALQQKEAA